MLLTFTVDMYIYIGPFVPHSRVPVGTTPVMSLPLIWNYVHVQADNNMLLQVLGFYLVYSLFFQSVHPVTNMTSDTSSYAKKKLLNHSDPMPKYRMSKT
jgi:hypothetical protein